VRVIEWRTRPTRPPPDVLKDVCDEAIEAEIRSGRVFVAMRLYQEKTGATLQEAGAQVDAWRRRLHLS
jgi:hypothetical protein